MADGLAAAAGERLALGAGVGVARGRPEGAALGVGTGVGETGVGVAVALGRGVGVAVGTGAGGRVCSIEKFSSPGSDCAAAGNAATAKQAAEATAEIRAGNIAPA